KLSQVSKEQELNTHLTKYIALSMLKARSRSFSSYLKKMNAANKEANYFSFLEEYPLAHECKTCNALGEVLKKCSSCKDGACRRCKGTKVYRKKDCADCSASGNCSRCLGATKETKACLKCKGKGLILNPKSLVTEHELSFKVLKDHVIRKALEKGLQVSLKSDPNLSKLLSQREVDILKFIEDLKEKKILWQEEVKKSQVTGIHQRFVKKKVQKKGSSVFLEIPMLKQVGNSCVPNAYARVLMYYGRSASVDDLSNSMGTTDTGTNYNRARETINSSEAFNAGAEYCQWFDSEELRESYSKAVNKEIDSDWRTFLESKPKFKSKTSVSEDLNEKFLTFVKKSIDNGMPILWSVICGVATETNRDTFAHLRIIHGYNESKNEIFFTDSWGKGHELKKLDMNLALLISTEFSMLVPEELEAIYSLEE
ncbi:MAG: C39 family peptidase, partial [Lentisphaeraceae bacterium]|nr:C39 family peptidase [Lentisphaeraceae bacterium]